MKLNWKRSLLILLACSVLTPLIQAERIEIFNGEPRLIIVNGYSTSRHWWAMLQRKIDRFQPGERMAEVNLVNRGGSPIARWVDVATGEPTPTWTERLRPAIAQKGDRPLIVLGQQSLQGVFATRRDGVRGPDDTSRIEQGADAIEKYVRLLRKEGADHVFVAMHIYKKSMEPAIGHERLALAAALKRNIPNFHAGPDVWEPTSKLWPQAFAADKAHPSSIGAEILAHYWFATLLEYDGLEAPEWSRREMEAALA
ncbi:MAG: SGNH/GDSL hydrolase family protein, partial [bacterium]|nr:SGNH/GDSL hydrolase family protein [bacterium]